MVTSALASYRPLASSALAFNWCIYWYLKKRLVLNSSILNNDWYERVDGNKRGHGFTPHWAATQEN
jgi:hypothetical protein